MRRVWTIVTKTYNLYHFKQFFPFFINRFAAKPIFSAHTNGSKHKYERFWREDEMIVMSMFAPIMYPPANVLVNFTIFLIHSVPVGHKRAKN